MRRGRQSTAVVIAPQGAQTLFQAAHLRKVLRRTASGIGVDRGHGHSIDRSGNTVGVTDTNDEDGNGLDWGQTSDEWLTDQMWSTDTDAQGYPMENISLTFDNSQASYPDQMPDAYQSPSHEQMQWYRLPLADDHMLPDDQGAADDQQRHDEQIDIVYRFAANDCCDGNAGPYGTNFGLQTPGSAAGTLLTRCSYAWTLKPTTPLSNTVIICKKQDIFGDAEPQPGRRLCRYRGRSTKSCLVGKSARSRSAPLTAPYAAALTSTCTMRAVSGTIPQAELAEKAATPGAKRCIR
jgi:hypothetical protein